MAEAASNSVGIPFAAPMPRSMKPIISGTTTAGDTAPSTEPSTADSK